MANPEHLAILKQGVDVWNEWRRQHTQLLPDLNGADLGGLNARKADFSGADLGRSDLCGAVLRMTDLTEANLSGAVLRGVDLSDSDLIRTSFRRADLRGANLAAARIVLATLTDADLREASLVETYVYGTDLAASDFAGAEVGLSDFVDDDLSRAKGLDTVRHVAPSSVGIDTVFRSCGRIPEVFLRGCGVPEEFIAYIGSMVGRPIEYYSCFISYSTKDQAFADRLYADLQAKGVRCWFAPHDITGGRKIHEQIDEAIRVHDKLLLILSEHSMASDWVGTEIANAREREAREKKQMLFPITIAPFEEVMRWKQFDADRGKIRRGRFGSITFRTSAGGRATTRDIRGSLRSWWGR